MAVGRGEEPYKRLLQWLGDVHFTYVSLYVHVHLHVQV